MLPSTFYHLYTHANGSENLFRKPENYRYFLQKYDYYISPIADTYCYCLMPNHIHFLIKIKSEEELMKVWKEKFADKPFEGLKTLEGFVIRSFSHLLNGYSQAYNKMYNRQGSLFRHPFKRKPILNDTYFTKVIHYIHANPVHHGFVKKVEDWEFSSYHSLLSTKNTKLQRSEVLQWFYGKEDFIIYHQQPVEPKLKLEMDSW